eukprot:235828_1
MSIITACATEAQRLRDTAHHQLQFVLSNALIPVYNTACFRSSRPLLEQIHRISKASLRIVQRTFRILYWLLAPNMIFKLIIRHMILFVVMFAIPPIIRSTIKPIWILFQHRVLLKIVMGSEWVAKYTQIKHQCHEESVTYDEYAHYGSQLDELSGYDSWRINKTSKLYSHKRIQQDVLELAKFREKGDNVNETHRIRSLMEFIRSRIERNYCGITNPKLYSICTIGTKKLIEDWIDNMCQSLHHIADSNHVCLDEKIVFFQEIRHVLGRTALCLSGGGNLCCYHIGVLITMAHNNLLPKIITGSSAGACYAALICTTTDYDQLEDALKQPALRLKIHNVSSWRQLFGVLWAQFKQTGYLLDVKLLRDCVRGERGDMTFLEGYQKTGRILNISVSGSEGNTLPRLLNYLTAPNVTIWSAVTASCAIPMVFEPQQLFIKSPSTGKIEPFFLEGVKFSDGSLAHDLPMEKIGQLFNVDNFIVSQTNPHLVPFLWHSIASPISLFDRIFKFLSSEFHHYLSTALLSVDGIRHVNKMLTQKYAGDCTIIPAVPISDYLRVLNNPDPDYVDRVTIAGSKATFEHISRLQVMCATEFTIDECLNSLRTQHSGQMQRDHQSFSRLNRAASFVIPNVTPQYVYGVAVDKLSDRSYYSSELSDLFSDIPAISV